MSRGKQGEKEIAGLDCALIAKGFVWQGRIRIDWDLGFRYSQTCEFCLQAGGLLCVLLRTLRRSCG